MKIKTNPWKDLKVGDTLVAYVPSVERREAKVLKVLRDESGNAPMVEIEYYRNGVTRVLRLEDFDHGVREVSD